MRFKGNYSLVMIVFCIMFLLLFFEVGGGTVEASGRIEKINGKSIPGNLGTSDEPFPVPRECHAQGNVQNVPKNQYIWIVVHPHGSLYWPQLSAIMSHPRSGNWTQTFYIGPSGGDFGKKFDVLLVMCEEEVNDMFNQWLAKCQKVGRFDGITLPSKIEVLDIVTVIKSKNIK